MWRQRFNGTKCHRMLEAIKCPYRRQMYADRIVELFDVCPSITFVGFTQLSMSDQSHGFDYHSHMRLYDQNTSEFHGLHFPKLAFLSLSDNGLDTSSSSAAFVWALSHLFGSRLRQLECSLVPNILQCFYQLESLDSLVHLELFSSETLFDRATQLVMSFLKWIHNRCLFPYLKSF